MATTWGTGFRATRQPSSITIGDRQHQIAREYGRMPVRVYIESHRGPAAFGPTMRVRSWRRCTVDVFRSLVEQLDRGPEFLVKPEGSNSLAAIVLMGRFILPPLSHQAVDALVQLIWRFGGTPAAGGTDSGAMHRGWVHVKGAVGANSQLSMLEECERGEDAAVARYRKALKQNLPPEVRSFVERQAQGAQRNHDHLRDLRNEARAHG